MPLSFQCPHCQLAYNVPEQMAGKNAKCKCGQQITVPQVSAPRSAPVRSPSAAPTQAAPRPVTPPAAPAPVTHAPNFNTMGLWQAGHLLVMRNNAQLPTHLCIKTGGPAATQRTEKLKWVPGWVAATALAGRIVHYAVSESHGRTCTVRFGLSRGASLFRLLPLIAGYTLVGIGLLCFVGNIVWMFTFHQEGDPIPTIGFLVGGGIGVVGAIISQLVGSVLKATAMDDNFVVLRGVSPALLSALPPWPGEVPQGKSK